MNAWMRVPVVIALGLALVGAALTTSSVDPASRQRTENCPGPEVAFTTNRLDGYVHYRVESVRDGPYHLDALWYSFVPRDGSSPGLRGPVVGGPWSLGALVEEGPTANLRFVSTGDSSILDMGDTLSVEGNETLVLHLYDDGGRIVGGSWECGTPVPSRTHPAPGCGASKMIDVGIDVGERNVTYTVDRVSGGPFFVEDLSYSFRPLEDGQSAPPGGHLVDAHRNQSSNATYRDQVGSAQTMDAGDAIVLDIATPYGIVIQGTGDRLLGGTWACA